MYESKLESHESVAEHTLADLPNVSCEDSTDKETMETPVIFYDTASCEYYERVDGDGEDGSRCNENEATIVRNYVQELVTDVNMAMGTVLIRSDPGSQRFTGGPNICDHSVSFLV